MSNREFDVVVIGAGPAGEVAAGRLATRGKSVAVVEQHLVGGECSYYACMPSKSLLRPQELMREAKRIPGAAEAVTGELDVPAVLARRDEVIHHLDDSVQVPWLTDRGVELVRGHGRLAGERRVEIDGGDEVLEAREAVIVAVGSGPLFPPIPGLADVGAWSNREITTSEEVPTKLLVLGGGVVGIEMAQAWRSLGSEVVIIEALERLASREEPFVSDQVAETFGELGIELRLGVRASAVAREGDEIAVTLADGSVERGTHLLVCIGRHPLTDDLGLDTLGLKPGRPIETDRQLRVPGHDWLYAIGDANGRALLTHMGKYHGHVATDAILGADTEIVLDGGMSPRVIFTDPQIAAVGHTLASAEEAGLSVDVIDLSTSANAGASFYGRNAPGSTRFIVDRERQVLVGVTFQGAEIADFLQAATIAIIGEVPLKRLVHAVAPFPTRSEIWLNFLDQYGV